MIENDKNQKDNMNPKLIDSFEIDYIFDSKPINRIKNKPTIENTNSKLNALKEKINNINNCDLKNNGKQIVFNDGNSKSPVMVVGEGPGQKEDELGKPFVGDAGQLLNKMLAAIHLDRDSVYITNVLPWRPPNNRTPSNKEIIECLPFLQKHIEIVNPSLIILLGATAAKTVLATTHSISKLRGSWHNYMNLTINKPILTRATYHPAFLLRSPKNKRETWDDLKEIQKKINNLDEKI